MTEPERSRAGRPTSTEAAQLAERLRRAAFDVFLRYGYDGTTMEAVAQAAGVTKATLYARFSDKRALFLAVSSWALTRQERDERVLEPLPDDLGQALTVIARAILARSVDPDIVRMSRMAIAESARFPEFAASTQAVTWSPRVQVIMDLLRRHARSGALAVEDVELAAEQFFAMVGAMPAWLAAYGIYRTPDEEERHLRHAVELFLNGVRVRDGAGAERPPAREPVERRRLGDGGPLVSRVALDASRSGAELIHRYLDAGGNLVDVGDAAGESLETCGRALRDRRESVVLAATVAVPDGTGDVRRRVRESCQDALRRLDTGRIDLCRLRLDAAVPLEEAIAALDDLVRAGEVRHVGAVDLPAYRLMKALAASDRMGAARFVSFQAPYTPTDRDVEREHLPLLAEEGLGFICAAPRERDLAVLAWQLARPVTSAIIAPRTIAELDDALAATAVGFTAGGSGGRGRAERRS